MSYLNQGKRGADKDTRTAGYMRGAGYKHGGRVADDGGDTHISINIGDKPGGPPGIGAPVSADEDKKKAFAAGLTAGAQAGAPPPPQPMGAPPGGPGMLPGGPPMPGMKRGGRVSKARVQTTVGPGVKPATPPTRAFKPERRAVGGLSKATERNGPPINNKKNGGGVLQLRNKDGGAGSGLGRLRKTADEKRSDR